MIIFGWGKTTKKFVAQVFEKTCSYCNTTEIWRLCIVRTWFTLFFIPVIPYKTAHCIICPKCGSYIPLTKEQFEQFKLDLSRSSAPSNGIPASSIESDLKYSGKTETQTNYLKQMEEFNNQ